MAEGFRPTGIYPWIDPISIVVQRGAIVEKSLSKTPIEGEVGPLLEFTAEACGSYVVWAGGRHRYKVFLSYKATLRADLARTREHLKKVRARSVGDDASGLQVAELETKCANLERAYRKPAHWAVPVYYADDVDDELGAFMSRNSNTPSLKQTDQERFWAMVPQVKKMYRELLAVAHHHIEDASIGSSQWAKEIVGRVLPVTDIQKGMGALFKELRAWMFVSLLAELPHVRDGKHATLEQLKARMRAVESSAVVTKRASEGKKKRNAAFAHKRPPGTAGGIWADMLMPILRMMAFVATGGKWHPEMSPRLRNYLKFLALPPDLCASHRSHKDVYDNGYQDFRSSGSVESEVWHDGLICTINGVYKRKVQGAMSSVLKTSTTVRQEAMTNYWELVDRLVKKSWTSGVAHTAWGPDTRETMTAR
ncbi:hypothetical protein OH77DRAFT_1516767 [Trametes cingulata]|nr:hypothetical protein OH77DRAFT_1516767 [Trametes cingulata]